MRACADRPAVVDPADCSVERTLAHVSDRGAHKQQPRRDNREHGRPRQSQTDEQRRRDGESKRRRRRLRQREAGSERADAHMPGPASWRGCRPAGGRGGRRARLARRPAGARRAGRASTGGPRRPTGSGRAPPARARGARSRLQGVAQRGEPLLADAVDLRELSASDRKPPCASRYSMMRCAERRADAVDAVELLDRRRREVDASDRAAGRPARGRCPACAGRRCRSGRRRRRTRRRHHDLLPVRGGSAARLTPVRSARRVGPPARASPSATREPGGSLISPGRRTAPARCRRRCGHRPSARGPSVRRPCERRALRRV